MGVRTAVMLITALPVLIDLLASSGAPRAQDLTDPCAAIDPKTDKFLACVVATLKATESKNPSVNSVLTEPIRGYLVALENASGYQGSASDLDELKRRSKEFKRDPRTNRDAIAILDSAIASRAGELRSILDYRTYAVRAKPGDDIYPVIVRESLAFFDSGRAKFYDSGPYEELVRTWNATLLEAAYFLGKAAGNPDESKLDRELEVLGEALDRVTRPEYDYVLRPDPGERANAIQFWRAGVLFMLGRLPQSREILRNLAVDNQKFTLFSVDFDHIHIPNAFALPAENIVKATRDQDGVPEIDIRDPGSVDRTFNPAQLALVACAHLNDAGPERHRIFMAAIGETVLTDYYVLAASANDRASLESLDTAIADLVNGEKLRKERDAVLKAVEAQDKGFSGIIERGARLCDVAESVRDQIFSKFQFRSQIEHVDKYGKYTDYLLFGGRLNAGQARTVSNFLNRSVFRELAGVREKLGIRETASIARMQTGR